jgi:hypothetical protein
MWGYKYISKLCYILHNNPAQPKSDYTVSYQVYVGDFHTSDAAVQQVVNDVEEEDAETQRGQHDIRVDVIISVLAA